MINPAADRPFEQRALGTELNEQALMNSTYRSVLRGYWTGETIRSPFAKSRFKRARPVCPRRSGRHHDHSHEGLHNVVGPHLRRDFSIKSPMATPAIPDDCRTRGQRSSY